MRILVVNQYFYPDRSATAQLLTELCDDLSQHHEIQVVAGRPSYNQARSLDTLPFPISDVRVSRAWSTTFNRAWMPGRLTNYATYLTTSLAAAITATRPDLVLAWTDPPLIGLVAAMAAKAKRVPFVLATQDIFPDVAIQLGRLTSPAVIRLLRGTAGRQFSSAVRIVSLGRDMDRRLEALGVQKQKIRTVGNWADGSLIRPLSHPSPMREAWGFGNSFVVMHAGNVGLSQSLETLIDAADLLRGHSDILIAIVGEGAAKARLQADVHRRGITNVRFLAFQPKESLSESLAAGDAHLVSLKRGLAGFIVPSKVYGIMAAGRPIIAAVESDSEPGLIVEEYGCGLRIEPDDPGALAEGILRMRDTNSEEMGRRGRRAFEQSFDRGIATTAYRKLLEEVVEEARYNKSFV
ncbi:MAG TPA: glycosyltransferase family 4 protein [Candidatus Dormibacteraeota bacterium]|nr:glycosyltransferase family 4 protein [Candidatus Dormibacteraeota bacterium]